MLENLDLPPTTGALGTERPTLKRNKQEDVGRSALDRMPAQNAPVSSNVLPAHSDAPKAPPENLAGVPDLQLNPAFTFACTPALTNGFTSTGTQSAW